MGRSVTCGFSVDDRLAMSNSSTCLLLGDGEQAEAEARTALELVTNKPEALRSVRVVGGAAADLAAARLLSGDLDGAADALERVWIVPSEQRATGLLTRTATARSPPAFWNPYSVGEPSVPVRPKDASASDGLSRTSDASVRVRSGRPAYTDTVETCTHGDAASRRARTARRTSRGGSSELDVSTTASQGPSPASLLRSATSVRSPRTGRTPETSRPDRPRLNVVTSQPRRSASSATLLPRNHVPPKTRIRMPKILPFPRPGEKGPCARHELSISRK